MKKVVVACFGDEQSIAAIGRLAGDAEVIAVAFDLCGAAKLRDVCETALAAGAARCHALDVREEFAREALLPALRSGVVVASPDAIARLAAPFIAGKLREIAAVEQSDYLPPRQVHVVSRELPQPPVDPLHVDIRFDNGVPTAINGVEMTLTELLESVETITGQPALAVLHRHITS